MNENDTTMNGARRPHALPAHDRLSFGRLALGLRLSRPGTAPRGPGAVKSATRPRDANRASGLPRRRRAEEIARTWVLGSGTSQGGGTTRRAGPAGNFAARTVHAKRGGRGGGGGGSLWTTPRAAARNRARESMCAALEVVAGATPRTGVQRGGRMGLV